MRTDLVARGYHIDTATRAMGMAVDDVRPPPRLLELAPPEWSEYHRFLVPDGPPQG